MHRSPPADGVLQRPRPAPPCLPGHQGRTCTEQGLRRWCSDLQPSPGTYVLVNAPAGAGHLSLTKGSLLPEVAAGRRQRGKLSSPRSVSCFPPLGPRSIPALLSAVPAAPAPCTLGPWPALKDAMAQIGSLPPKCTLLQPKSPHCPQPRRPGPARAPSQPLCYPNPLPQVGGEGDSSRSPESPPQTKRRLNKAHPTN